MHTFWPSQLDEKIEIPPTFLKKVVYTYVLIFVVCGIYNASESQETHGDPEVLVTALKATQEKKDLLEQSLSAETKVKMDLFSALGEAKRDISMKDGELKE